MSSSTDCAPLGPTPATQVLLSTSVTTGKAAAFWTMAAGIVERSVTSVVVTKTASAVALAMFSGEMSACSPSFHSWSGIV